MLYATPESLIKRYTLDVLLSLAGKADDTLDEDKINEALEDATSTINSYLAGRYSLPLKNVPTVLERHCCYIARYFLEKNRALDQARRDYDDSIRFLEKVASGAVSLGLDENQATAESNNAAIIESGGSIWARDRAKGFV